MEKTDLLPSRLSEFRERIKEKSMDAGYASALNLGTTKGACTQELLKEALEIDELPEGLQDLTQLPEEALYRLYLVCGKAASTKTSSYPSNVQSHLKKVRAAIKSYFELVLGKGFDLSKARVTVLPKEEEGLHQTGSWCFSNLFRVWTAAAGKQNERKDVFRKIRKCSSSTSDLSISGRMELFPLDSWLPSQDVKNLREYLHAAVQEAGDFRDSTLNAFGASKETLFAMLQKLNEPVPYLEPEYERLQNLARYWDVPSLRNDKETLQEKRFFVKLLFTLLAAALDPERKEPFSPPAATLTGPKFLSALSLVQAPLAHELAQKIRKQEKWAEAYLYACVPNDWTWSEHDITTACRDSAIRQQLILLFGDEGREVFRRTWPSDRTSREYERTQAAQALLRLAFGVLENGCKRYQGTTERKDLDQLLVRMLSCYFEHGPDQASEKEPPLRAYLFQLQNSRLGQLEDIVEKHGMASLSEIMKEVRAASKDSLLLLRLARELDSVEKRILDSLIDQEELAADLPIGDLLELTTPEETTSPAPIVDSSEGLCPVWDGKSDYMRPYVSNTFDSVNGFDASEMQLHLASLILCSGRVVLTLPQITDNPNLLNLAFNASFRALICGGSVAVSLFAEHYSLLEYAINTLKNNDFYFSGYSSLFNDKDDPDCSKYIRSCVASYLKASDQSGRRAAQLRMPYMYVEEMTRYAESIRLLDEAIKQQRCAGKFPTLSQFFHQKTGWLCEEQRNGLLSRTGAYLEKLPDHSELMSLHNTLNHGLTTRSDIYAALDMLEKKQPEAAPAVQAYRTIVDWMYFYENAARVTPFKTIYIKKEDQKLLLPNHKDGENVTFQTSYTQTSNAQAAALDLSDLVKFVKEASAWVSSTHNGSAPSILRGVLDNDRSVEIDTSEEYGINYLKRLGLYVTENSDRKISVIEQTKKSGSTFTQLQHWG